VGRPLPAVRGGGDGRPVEPAAPLPEPAAGPDRAADHQAARGQAARPGPDRLGTAAEPIHRAPGPAPLRLPPAGAPGPGRQDSRTPLRAGPARRADPRRRQETRQHPRRRGPRVHGQQAGRRNRQATATPAGRTRHGNPILGYGYLHTALDDHSRLAYTEILPDERKDTAAAFLHRAHAWYTSHGITIERVISDNGSCYRSKLWTLTCDQLGITPRRTRPYRPQTNGKVERFHRTLADEWAYAQPYQPENERRRALPDWLHTYNNHRGAELRTKYSKPYVEADPTHLI